MNAVVPILQANAQFCRAMAEQGSRPFAPPQLAGFQVNFPERVLRGVGNAAHPLFALAERFLGSLLLCDVTLRSPGASDGSIFLNANQVIQEVFRVSIPVGFASFDVG